MKISEAEPGDMVTIKEGPAIGRKVQVVSKGSYLVAISGQGQNSVVRGDLEVE